MHLPSRIIARDVNDAYLAGVILFSIISTWIIGVRMRQRIKRDLDRKPNDTDLTSIATWMKVDEVEQKIHPGRDWAPREGTGLSPAGLDERIDLFPDGMHGGGKKNGLG